MILDENIESVYSAGREMQQVYSYGKLVWEKRPIDYNITPFTVRAVDGGVQVRLGKINPDNGKTIYINIKYSINGGNWINTTSKTIIKLNRNDRVSIISTDADFCTVRGDTRWEGMKEIRALSDISGNIMSLIYGDDFIGQTVWTRRYYYWADDGFFKMCDIRNAKNLILPATTLSEYAYENMFSHCYGLVSAPELPASTLVKGCYEQMFYNCEALHRIKCYAIGVKSNTLIEDCLKGWTGFISPSGTFECYESFADELRPYIPSTWTVEYLT
jgi:hypothetical protein